MTDFIPDAGRLEIVEFVCPCNGDVNLNVPLRRVAHPVVGWTSAGPSETAPGLLRLLPVVADTLGLMAWPLKPGPIGSARLAIIGEAQMTHREALELHRILHERRG